MKKLSLMAIALFAFAATSCHSDGTSSSESTETSASSQSNTNEAPNTPDTLALKEAAKGEHAIADATYNYDASTNTMLIVKEVEIPANQPEEDFAEAIVEHEVPNFIAQIKKSNKAGDVTIKKNATTITVKYVDKASGEEISAFDITPEDLK